MFNTIQSDHYLSEKAMLRSPARISRLRMTPILLSLLLISSCKQPDKPALGVPAIEPAVAHVPTSGLLPADPDFVATKDTFSSHGPRNITRSILQDRNGNLWFATWEGIIKYDGLQFTNLTLQAGLAQFHVFSILEDYNGNLWFGTIKGGVYRYDGSSFTRFTTEDGLPGDVILSLLEDTAGNIWFGTTKGASRYNGNTFTNFTREQGLRGNSIYTMAQDKTGKIWLGTENGISCFDGNGFSEFKNKNDKSFYQLRSILVDKTGNTWIGSQDGLCRYDGSALENCTRKSTVAILEDKTGKFWVSENKLNRPEMVLSKYNGNTFSKITERKQIFCLCEDQVGNIWFGTEQGVCRYDGKTFTDL